MRLPELMFLGALLVWPLVPLAHLLCIIWHTDFKLVARSKQRSTEGSRS